MPHEVRYLEDLEPLREGVRNAARRTIKKLNTLNTKSTDPLDALYTLKFDKSGYHPVNQTTTRPRGAVEPDFHSTGLACRGETPA